MKEKMKLEDIKVESFITSLTEDTQVGGSASTNNLQACPTCVEPVCQDKTGYTCATAPGPHGGGCCID